MKKRSIRWIFPVFPAAVMLLGAVPQSIVMRFMRDPALGGMYLHYCSYYDPITLSYGNMGPILTMALAAVLMVMTVWNSIRPNLPRQRYTALVAGVAAAASALNLLFREMTAYGWIISALLLSLTVLQTVYNHK